MLNRYEDSEASLVTRLISTALRHGTPIEFLVDQMAKSKVNITSLAKALARALALYIRQDEVKGKFKCYDCKSTNIKFEGTCKMCHDCGWSSCS
jgi:ribonucleoside-diphosphate reductase alpha chain